MSGGSLDYACHRVRDMADAVEAQATTPLHRAFADHLRKVETALHDLEWVWSGDTMPGDETAALRAVVSPGAVLSRALSDAVKARDELTAAISEVQP
jgi:hypothetical protein